MERWGSRVISRKNDWIWMKQLPKTSTGIVGGRLFGLIVAVVKTDWAKEDI